MWDSQLSKLALIVAVLPRAGVHTDLREHNCFTCMDKDGCLKIERIFGPDDHLLFERDLKDKIPNCSAVLPLANTCSICRSKSKIHIYCPKNIKTFDAEKDGEKIYNISIGCQEEENTNPQLYGPTTGAGQISAHGGFILGGLLFIMCG